MGTTQSPPSNEDPVTLELPAALCRQVEERLLADGERSLQELVIFVLEALSGDSVTLDEREEAVLEKRLEQLGYL